jgi:hypothetical protein
MNHAIDQRNEWSMRWLYRPLSDSRNASPNQPNSTASMATMPSRQTSLPQAASLTQAEAPTIVTSMEIPASIGQREGPGTK